MSRVLHHIRRVAGAMQQQVRTLATVKPGEIPVVGGVREDILENDEALLKLYQPSPATYLPRRVIKRVRMTKGDLTKEVKTRSKPLAQKLLEKRAKAIEEGKPHFTVGQKKIYFPNARITLLRPNAKHTPYQAKFIVPLSFNRMDLRDYLWHVYGLRALNVTTQLLHRKWTRDNIRSPRYREQQIKKMTIDMEQPFIWPEPPKDKNAWGYNMAKELETYADEALRRVGSDKLKPGTAFEGIVGPYAPAATPFIPKFPGRRLKNKARKAASKHAYREKLEAIGKRMQL